MPGEEDEEENEEGGADGEVDEAAGGAAQGRATRLEGVLDGHGFVDEARGGLCCLDG